MASSLRALNSAPCVVRKPLAVARHASVNAGEFWLAAAIAPAGDALHDLVAGVAGLIEVAEKRTAAVTLYREVRPRPGIDLQAISQSLNSYTLARRMELTRGVHKILAG